MLSITNAGRAEVLTQALPHIQKYYNKIIVIKYGGNAMISAELKEQVMEDIVLLSLVGVKVVLVHGGGPEITDMLRRVGKETVFSNGLRVTDKETVEIAQMVLAGKINKDLVRLLEGKGGRAIGLSGIDGGMLRAEMKNPELGYVGKVAAVDVRPIADMLNAGYIPVVSTLGYDADGNVYNINADTAAAEIAAAIHAERLFMMTDIAGILHDRNDESSLIPYLSVKEAEKLFETGVVSGGMIPKVECCLNAVQKGVSKVVIIDGRVPHSILLETLTTEGAGTMVGLGEEEGRD